MGLDFSHCNAHFSYHGFGEFRDALVKAIDPDKKQHLYDMYLDDTFRKYRDDPLFPLIDHSDNDGVLTPAELAKVIPRLEELLKKLDPESEHFTFHREQGKEMLRGMRKAYRNNEDFKFC